MGVSVCVRQREKEREREGERGRVGGVGVPSPFFVWLIKCGLPVQKALGHACLEFLLKANFFGC